MRPDKSVAMTRDKRLAVSTGEDVLSYIPHALGFWPTNSLVCLTLDGKTVGATLRVDLPGARPDASRAPTRASSASRARAGSSGRTDNLAGFEAIPIEHYVDTVCGYLQSDQRADGVLVAIFDSMDWTLPYHRPYAALLQRLQDSLDKAGTPVRDCWFLGPEHWRHYDCADEGCCGWPGRPLNRISDSWLNTELVYRGSSYRRDASEGIAEALLPLPAPVRAGIARARAGYASRLAGSARQPEQFRASLETWEDALDVWPRTPDVATTAFLLATLENVAVRDAVLVLASVGPRLAYGGAAACGLLESTPQAGVTVGSAGHSQPVDAARGKVPRPRGLDAMVVRPDGWQLSPERQHALTARFDVDPASPAHEFGAALVGAGTKRPNWNRMNTADLLLVHLASAGSGTARAAALTMLAWIAWCRGQGSTAHSYLERAVLVRPGYRLAELLLELLGQGQLCGWARSSATAWRPGQGMPSATGPANGTG
jgi:hypothetical protein